MPQQSWTVYDGLGRSHRVGIYHGEDSGHLLVYVNRTPVKIDFNVLDSYKLHFKVNEFLCKLAIDPKESGDGFDYKLILDQGLIEVKTKEEPPWWTNKWFYIIVGLFIGFVLALMRFLLIIPSDG